MSLPCVGACVQLSLPLPVCLVTILIVGFLSGSFPPKLLFSLLLHPPVANEHILAYTFGGCLRRSGEQLKVGESKVCSCIQLTSFLNPCSCGCLLNLCPWGKLCVGDAHGQSSGGLPVLLLTWLQVVANAVFKHCALEWVLLLPEQSSSHPHLSELSQPSGCQGCDRGSVPCSVTSSLLLLE